jgi:hypothetical protein
MRLSLRGSRRAVTAAMAATVAVVGLGTAACSPPNNATKVISGTIKGVDGNVVDVMLGFDVVDAAGNKLDLGYIKAGYSSIQRLNHCVSNQGASGTGVCPATYQPSTRIHTAAQATTYKWSLRVPANAASVYVEVYPKAPTPNNWVSFRGYTGPMPGNDDTSKYGMAYRRAIPVPASRSGVQIVLPKTCNAGGNTGSLVGHVNGWYGGAGSIYTWSMANDQATMGFGIGKVDANGNYRIDHLAAGQRYGVQAQNSGGFFRSVVNYRVSTSDDTLIAGRCQTKAYNF